MLTTKRLSTGFTLLELLVALALFATLATIAVPSFARNIQENRVITTTNDYKIALSFARSEAVRRNQTVRLQPTAGGWSTGWEVIANGESLRRWEPSAADLTIEDAPANFRFNSLGRLVGADFTSQNVSLTLGDIGRCVRVEPSGISRVLTQRQACD
ncbi:GspH/FimT family protein [Halomonas sp. NyZ770]|uniref:GspH/FimT family pseudopilin n=1 Tax=Halomonas sp. NyZ770 TaxID=2883106 RepID=UPI001D0A4C7B|nr:GspH/FimT family protein [Halomonas sp. NyZ770]UDM07028.1 GspH/FimT family protein [Halomonas sp. NyZ770]